MRCCDVFLVLLVINSLKGTRDVLSFVLPNIYSLSSQTSSDFSSLIRSPLRESAVSTEYKLTHSYSLNVPNPSYVQILQKGWLSVTSFSFLRRGSITQFNLLDHYKDKRQLDGEFLWPNELTQFTTKNGHSMMIVPDGFLFPGQDNGGLLGVFIDSSKLRNDSKVSSDATNNFSSPLRITKRKKGWFYHRALYVCLPGPNKREGILTARAHKPLLGPGRGELVWISIPDNPSSIKDLPWPETVLVEGPDVMFETVDLDTNDNSIEVIAAHFFGRCLSVHSLSACDQPPHIRLTNSHALDTEGQPYGLCLATMPSFKSLISHPTSDSHSTRLENESSCVVHETNDITIQPSTGSLNFKFSSQPSTSQFSSPSPVFPQTPMPPTFNGPTRSNSRRQSSTSASFTNLHSLTSHCISPTELSMHSTLLSQTPSIDLDLDLDINSRQLQKASLISSTSTSSQVISAAQQSTNSALSPAPTHLLVTTHECSYDLFSTVKMAGRALLGQYPRIRLGSSVGHEYSRSHSQSDSVNAIKKDTVAGRSLFGTNTVAGGSLFAYQLPRRPWISPNTSHSGVSINSLYPLLDSAAIEGINPHQKSSQHQQLNDHAVTNGRENRHFAASLEPLLTASLETMHPPRITTTTSLVANSTPLVAIAASTPASDWHRHTLCAGFKVKGWGGIFSPGAPGFPYVFHLPNSAPQSLPLILLAGDCTGSAYIFTPQIPSLIKPKTNNDGLKEGSHTRRHLSNTVEASATDDLNEPVYDLAFEIECGATVGSAAVAPAQDGSDAVDIFLPSYELNQVNALRLSKHTV